MISRFNLPRLAENFEHYFIQSHLSPSPRSSSDLHDLSLEKPFINDPERSILGIAFNFFNDERWISFSLLVRWQYLLACCLGDIALMEKSLPSRTPHHIYPWEEWGPQNSRLVSGPYNFPVSIKTAGARWVSLVDNRNQSNKRPQVNPSRKVEVYDFDETRTRIAGQQAVTTKHRGRSIWALQIQVKEGNNEDTNSQWPLVELVDSSSPSIYPTANGIFSQKVYTHLPYLRTTYITPDSSGGRLKKKQKRLAEWTKQIFRRQRDSSSTSQANSNPKASEIDIARRYHPRPDLCEWDGLLVDEERIIGMKYEWDVEEMYCPELDILYLG